GGPRCQETVGDTTAQTKFESVSKHFNDSLLAKGNTLQSDEDRIKLNEMMELCINLQNRVLNLEKTKTSQRNEIDSLRRKVKKLEKRNKSRTHKLKRLYKGKRINAINDNDEITLVNDADNEMFDVYDLGGEEVFVAEQEVAKRIVFQEPGKSTTTPIISSQQSHDKGKGIMIKEPVKPKKKIKSGLMKKLVKDEEEVAIDAIPLAVKSPRIVDWKIHKEGKKSYYQIMRANEKSQMYMFFSQMLKSFDKEDLEDLYKLVKARYGSTRSVENMDYLLWSDLKTMFEPHVEDEIWKMQQGYKVFEWKLYDSCKVHSLMMQSMSLWKHKVLNLIPVGYVILGFSSCFSDSALEKEQIMKKYEEVTARLEQDLEGIVLEKVDISDEVKEQVALVLAQFKRAKGKTDAPDLELSEDLSSLYNKGSDVVVDPDVLKRLVEKLQLTGINDLTHESITLHEMVSASDGDPGETIEKMSMLLKRIKDFVVTENPNAESPPGEASDPPMSTEKRTLKIQNNTILPDDFRCPISLELMKDPVIVSTGQTYERKCIQKWLEAGHKTCPKTQQKLTSTALIPNYVLRSLIAQWCETNGLEPPKQAGRPSSSACTPAERSIIDVLLTKLKSVSPDDQRTAAGEIRLLAKRNGDNRVAIAEAGAIPLLTHLLSVPDSRTQEHAVTALLNLSICEDNKGSIVSSGAVPGIVHVLKRGSMEARENAAATLFSLSVVDENKVTIGSLGAIPPLVLLLREGTQRGKKDAATALFNLCIYQGNKGRAVRAGVITTLMELLTEPEGAMKDEALAILAILSGHPEAKIAIGKADAVRVLVDFIASGSPRNKENAAAVMVHLFSGDQKCLVEAQELGVMGALVHLLHHGTDRGKRKAGHLLEKITRYTEQQKLPHLHAETESNN
nr:U-box domain-containing protein 13-like isoform X1 [Tanacetum cinerariifolium]